MFNTTSYKLIDKSTQEDNSEAPYRGQFEDGDVVIDVGLGVVGTPDDALHPDGLGADALNVPPEVVLAQADHQVGGALHAVHGSDRVPLEHHHHGDFDPESFRLFVPC